MGQPKGQCGLLRLGSNVGQRRANLQSAVEALPAAQGGVLASSSTYATDDRKLADALAARPGAEGVRGAEPPLQLPASGGAGPPLAGQWTMTLPRMPSATWIVQW